MYIVKIPKKWKGLPSYTIRVWVKGPSRIRYIKIPNHPYSTNGWYPFARWLMEKKMKRFILPNEVLAHINGNSLDDRISNYRVFPNHEVYFSSLVNSKRKDFVLPCERATEIRFLNKLFGVDKYKLILGKIPKRKKKKGKKKMGLSDFEKEQLAVTAMNKEYEKAQRLRHPDDCECPDCWSWDREIGKEKRNGKS